MCSQDQKTNQQMLDAKWSYSIANEFALFLNNPSV